MLHSHYDYKQIKRLKIKHVSKLLVSAFKRREKENAFDMWLLHFQRFVKRDAFVPFEEFYNVKPVQKNSNKSKVEIMDDVELIQHSMRGGKRGTL